MKQVTVSYLKYEQNKNAFQSMVILPLFGLLRISALAIRDVLHKYIHSFAC